MVRFTNGLHIFSILKRTLLPIWQGFRMFGSQLGGGGGSDQV